MKEWLKQCGLVARHKKERSVHVKTVRNVGQLSAPPPELQHIFSRKPQLEIAVARVLNQGAHIRIHTVTRTQGSVVKAINSISHYSQELTVTTWLPQFIREGKKPVITDADREAAHKQQVDLDEQLRLITQEITQYKVITIEYVHAKQLEQQLNTELTDYRLEYASRCMVFDSSHARTEIAQAIVKALLFIGPIAHFLELFFRGIGKIFAACADDLMTETAEFFALRGSGFEWKTIAKRAYILVPVLILATYGLLKAEYFIEHGELFIAGVLFGIGAVALSLTTAIQSVFMFHARMKKLEEERKVQFPNRKALWWSAVKQDFTNPARLGLFAGAIASPIVAGIVFLSFPQFVHNGWVLALLGSTETIVAGVAVIQARRINEYTTHKALQNL